MVSLRTYNRIIKIGVLSVATVLAMDFYLTCREPKKNNSLDDLIAESFVLKKDTLNGYRVSVDEDYILEQNERYDWKVKNPAFRDRFVRESYVKTHDGNNFWISKVPIGKYMIDDVTVVVSDNDKDHTQKIDMIHNGTIRCIVNTDMDQCYDEGLFQTKIDTPCVNNKGAAILQVSFCGKDYFSSNAADSTIISYAEQRLMPLIRRIYLIDQDELTQYADARKRYIEDRSNAVINAVIDSMKIVKTGADCTSRPDGVYVEKPKAPQRVE